MSKGHVTVNPMIPGTIVQGCCHRLTNHGTMYYMTLLSPLGNFPMCSRVAIVLESNHFPRYGDGPTIPSMSKGHVTVNPMIPGTTVQLYKVVTCCVPAAVAWLGPVHRTGSVVLQVPD